MKNITIISTILLTSSLSFAIVAKPKPVVQPPVVKCDYSVNVRGEQGETIDYKNGEPVTVQATENKTTSVLGFNLKSKLERNCIQVGGKPGQIGGIKCSDVYTIKTTLGFQGGISGSSQMDAKKSDKNKNYSHTLTVGNREATVRCFVQ